MIKVIINSTALIKNAPYELIQTIKADLTMDNPKYEDQIKKGRSTRDMDPFVVWYITRGSSLFFPRGYMNALVFRLQEGNYQYEIIDNTVCPKLLTPINFNGEFRKYQELAIEDCVKRRYGMIDAPTGSGKTIIAIGAMVKRQTTTLIVVHNKELLNQWTERIKRFLNYDVGTIGDGKFEVKDITVGIINSVNTHIDSLVDVFGYIIYDECHRAIGNTWVGVINGMMPKYHTGFTATAYRSDGLTKSLYAVLGPKLHIVDKTMLEDTGAILIPKIIRVSTQFWIPDYDFEIPYSKVIGLLTLNSARNQLIAETVNLDVKKYKDSVLVVSDRVEHIELLYELISSYPGIRALMLHGKVSRKDRVKGVADFKAGKYNVLISTLSLIGEGFDAPDLSAIFMGTPIKFAGRVIQSIGRVLRPSDSGEMPRVYDFRDWGVPVLKYSGFSRDRTYSANGWI